MLGRHVSELALDLAGLRADLVHRRLGDAEIDDLHLPVVRDEKVMWAHVAVNDLERPAVQVPEVVRVVEPREGVRGDPCELRMREKMAVANHDLHHPMQRLTLEVLHREEERAGIDADLIRVHHVRMIEAHRETRLVEEHRCEVLLGCPRALEDDELLRIERTLRQRQIDVGHAAGAEALERRVAAELRGRPRPRQLRGARIGSPAIVTSRF